MVGLSQGWVGASAILGGPQIRVKKTRVEGSQSEAVNVIQTSAIELAFLGIRSADLGFVPLKIVGFDKVKRARYG